MSDAHYWVEDYDLSSTTTTAPGHGPSGGPFGGPLPPVAVHSELGTALCLVGLLLLLLLFLVVRCIRILLDPYSSMPSSSRPSLWSVQEEDGMRL